MKPVYFLLMLHICLCSKMLQAQTLAEHNCSKHAAFTTENEARKKHTNSPQLNALMQKYDVNFYKLDINLTNTSNYISGSGIIMAKVTAAKLDTFAFELKNILAIDSIYINGKKYLEFERNTTEDVTTVKLNPALTKNDVINAQIYYHGNPPTEINSWKLGLINEKDNDHGVNITHSLSVPYSASNWWPCKQIMTDVADSVHVFVTTDTFLQVAGNGKLAKIENVGGRKHQFQWKTNYPINYYLVSVAVAPYFRNEYKVKLNGETDEMLVQDFIYDLPTPRQDAETQKLLTEPLLQNFSNLFGKYPFYNEKYGIYMLPLGGGMEHQTMSAIGNIKSKYLLAHEMGHQWFGDNVNLVSFRDMWLNEGFASYCEYLTAEFLYPAEAPAILNDLHGTALVGSGKIYVDDTLTFSKLYDYRLVYRKGAVMIHMLRFIVNNDSVFFNALTSYQQKYSGKNVTTAIFKQHLEAETGLDFTEFFNQWYYGEGYPTFTVTWNQVGNSLKLKVLQTTSSTKTKLFRTPVELLVKRVEGDTIIKYFHAENTTYAEMEVRGTVTNIVVDPNEWILNNRKPSIKDVNLAVPKNKKTGFAPRVYPNPNYGKLYIDVPENALPYGENLLVEIYNTTGQNRHTEKITNRANSIDISHFPGGLYIVVVKNASGVSSTSLVKM